MFLVHTWTLAILLLFTSAGSPLHSEEGAASGWPVFVDVSESAGVPFVHRASATPKKFLLETMGSGVALLDYDGDGLLDIYLLNGAKLTPGMSPGSIPEKATPEYWNRLYRNNGNGSFSDTTEEAGVSGRGYAMGVAAGDYDNDGRPDLYVTNYPSNQLFRNQGDGTFREVTETAGVSGGGWSSSAGFFDYDGDGDLDLFVCRYMQWDFDDIFCGRSDLRAYCDPQRFPAVSNLLYRNDGEGTFTDVTQSSGIGNHPSKGLGVAFNDFDRDGRPDIVVANDGVPQSLFLESGKRRLSGGGPAQGAGVRRRRQHLRRDGGRLRRLRPGRLARRAHHDPLAGDVRPLSQFLGTGLRLRFETLGSGRGHPALLGLGNLLLRRGQRRPEGHLRRPGARHGYHRVHQLGPELSPAAPASQELGRCLRGLFAGKRPRF